MTQRVPVVPEALAARLAGGIEGCGALHAALRALAADHGPDAAQDALAIALRRVRTALRHVRHAVVDAADARAPLAELRAAATAVPALAAACAELADDLAAALPEHTPVRREFYVYLHRAPDGGIFYVGKGRGRRAWSTARTAAWRRYVEHHLQGRYAIEIHRDALTHAEALAIEAGLVAAHGARLVNWVNPSRDIDVAALERARLLRAETLGRVGTAQFLEASAPEAALKRYRLALDDVRVYSRIAYERGLLGELKELDRCGEPLVLDRLTRCLERLGRGAEILRVANEYFCEFPDARDTPAGARVRRRCERATAGRLHGVRGGAPAGPRGRRVLG